jgi:hypothetical protein
VRNRSTAARLLWLAATTLQLVLPGAAAWTDARLQRGAALSSRGASHVESHSTEQCPRAHPPDCALCRHLSTPVALAAAHKAVLWPTTDLQTRASGERAPRTTTLTLPPSRAPPLS